MDPLIHEQLPRLIAANGYWVVTLLVGLESFSLPLPGEAALIGAAAYAGMTGGLNIVGVILAASIGAVVGGSAGYWLGSLVGLPL